MGVGGGDGVDLRDVEGGGGRWHVQRLLGGRLRLVQEDGGLPLENLRRKTRSHEGKKETRRRGRLTCMVRQ